MKKTFIFILVVISAAGLAVSAAVYSAKKNAERYTLEYVSQNLSALTARTQELAAEYQTIETEEKSYKTELDKVLASVSESIETVKQNDIRLSTDNFDTLNEASVLLKNELDNFNFYKMRVLRDTKKLKLQKVAENSSLNLDVSKNITEANLQNILAILKHIDATLLQIKGQRERTIINEQIPNNEKSGEAENKAATESAAKPEETPVEKTAETPADEKPNVNASKTEAQETTQKNNNQKSQENQTQANEQKNPAAKQDFDYDEILERIKKDLGL
jgi:hypothetical protein